MKERDLYLDFYRGLATISIIFIHTVFHSGSMYVPELLRTISLIVDVPFFIFLSGWSFNYSSKPSRVIYNLLRLWIHWIVFIVLIDFFCIIFYKYNFHINDLRIQLFFYPGNSLPDFSVIQASVWFIPMYVSVVLCGSIIIYLFSKFEIRQEKSFLIIIFFLVGLAYINASLGSTWFFTSQTFCFYMSMLLLGWNYSKFKFHSVIKYYITCLTIIFLWFLLSRFYGISAKNLQNAKFPSHIMYFVASLLSISTAVFIKERNILKNILNTCIGRGGCFIGKNALCFYFSQGVGGSLLYKTVPYMLKYGWVLTLILSFLINFLVTLSLGIFLSFIFRFLDFIVENIKKR